jgi:type II secretory pathway component PulK
MNRHGFALLAVLWVLTALTAVVGAGVLVARLGSETTRNRVLLARAEWARDACGEILAARFVRAPTIRELAPIDLGRGIWCRASLEDPSAKVNLNTVEADALGHLFTSLGVPRELADSVIVHRKQGAIYDLRQIPGLDSVAIERLTPFVTTRGTGVINVNAAPPRVLRLLPGMTEESVAILMARRSTRPLDNADELAGTLSRSSRAEFLSSYAEFARTSVFAPPQLIATLEGGVRGAPNALVARATLTVVPVPGRLAVIRRESE